MPMLSVGDQPVLYGRPAPSRKLELKGISHRHYLVLSLHLAGYTAEQISEVTDYSPISVYSILKRDDIIQVRQALLEGIQMEFEALYKEVLEVLKDALKSEDETVRMQAVNSYFKEKGRVEGKNATQMNITAEDVVIQILNQAAGGR